MRAPEWYIVHDAAAIDSPALFVYPKRIQENLGRLLEKIPAGRLRPHVKTNKTAEVCRIMLDAGIRKFKAATIAEAEMLALIKAPDILLAYPPTITKTERLLRLIEKYPDSGFSCLIDHPKTANEVAAHFSHANRVVQVYIDLNVGMNRTGILPDHAIGLFQLLLSLPSLQVMGLHAYDGQIQETDPQKREKICAGIFKPVLNLKIEMENISSRPMTLIAGGSPTCFIHASAGGRECSPGTFIYWDKGYSEQLPEQPFEWAALVMCRVISIPAEDLICVDLGYKAVASEKPLPRVYFLNAPDAIPTAHSEEHLVLSVPDSSRFSPGDILYGVPYHICPTVALYDSAYTVENNRVSGSWDVIARKRKISV